MEAAAQTQMRAQTAQTLQALFGRGRAQVLAVLFALRANASGEADLHLREIARRAALSPTAAQYELRHLVEAGLVQIGGTAERPRYALDPMHALFRGLRQLFRAAAGSAAPIADDALWAKKRARQHADHASPDLGRKSVFLKHRELAQSARMKPNERIKY